MEVEAVQAIAQDVAADQAAAAEELLTDVDALCEQAAAFLAELVKQVRWRAACAAPWACQRIAGMCPAAVSVLTLEIGRPAVYLSTTLQPATLRRVTRRTGTSCAPRRSSCVSPSWPRSGVQGRQRMRRPSRRGSGSWTGERRIDGVGWKLECHACRYKCANLLPSVPRTGVPLFYERCGESSIRSR